MLQTTLQSIRALLVFTVITGVAYPLAVTGISQAIFKDRANGSLIVKDDKVLGSRLIGQPFSDPRYFWSRPSGTSPQPYNGAASSGTNQGPTNPALKEAVEGRVKALRDAGGDAAKSIPVDLVTASGSGLDPHISPAAAEYQIARVAKTRSLPEAKVKELVERYTEGRQLGVLGEPRVNVLELNLALDAATK
ncbi:MAG: potassium-transporting ATPase subunit KdpC [Betaproteobacteria bacterium]|nr:potassium-transporting ATPase subunit KdpC [Betaproteobacteria bacterium]MBV9360376.1 potassium-transporting ATPase subunit KdpC [Betaproteobacteria bacterium]